MVSRHVHSVKIARSTRALASILTLALLAGCAQQPLRSVPVALPLPVRPVLTPMPAFSVACLSDAAYTTLVNRERALKTWGLQLEAIIQSNNTHSQNKR